MTDKYTRSARGKPCLIRIYGHCTGGGEDTVACHLNGAGMGRKHLSIHVAYGCARCHDIVDGRVQTGYDRATVLRWHLEGVIRTQQVMVDDGVMLL